MPLLFLTFPQPPPNISIRHQITGSKPELADNQSYIL